MESGIYQFRNIITDQKYIGSAFILTKRKEEHLACLRKNKHHSYKFQQSFNEFGEDKFEYSILQYINKLEIESKKDFRLRLVNDREQFYLDTLLFASENNSKFDDFAYNINRKADSNLGSLFTQEHKDRIGQSQRESIYNQKVRKSKAFRDKIRKITSIKYQCIHCKIKCDLRNLRRWHNDNCHLNPNRTQLSIDNELKSINKMKNSKANTKSINYET